MKNIYALFLLTFLMVCPACETTEELPDKNATGILQVALASEEVDVPVLTRGDAGRDVEQFSVVITTSIDGEVSNFATFAEMKKQSPTLRLEKGSYVITASTSGEEPSEAAIPYFEGQQAFEIKPDSISFVILTCSMKSVRIKLGMSDALANKLSAWEATITSTPTTAGHTYSATATDDHYFKHTNGIFMLKVVGAKKEDGGKVSYMQAVRKKDNSTPAPGDYLSITLDVEEDDAESAASNSNYVQNKMRMFIDEKKETEE